MKITNENEEQVCWFARILRDMRVSQEIGMLITAMLKDEKQMDKLVAFIKENLKATEIEILEKAEEISGVICNKH